MKKSFIILALLLCLAALCGCAAGDSQDKQASLTANKFLALLNEKNYTEAYELLSSNAKSQISQTDFVTKYTNIFSQLKIVLLSYTGAISSSTPMSAVFDYHGSYESGLCEDLSYDFSMKLLLESDTWTVDWTPALIFADLRWGDSVRFRTLKASRGEIFAGDQIIAQNTTGICVYANPELIDDVKTFANTIGPLISMNAEEVEKKINKAGPYLALLKNYKLGALTISQQKEIEQLKGAGIDKSSFYVYRSYPMGECFFHLVGYVGTISAKQLEEVQGTDYEPLYNEDSVVGQMGLEMTYERELVGKDGIEIYIQDKDGVKRGAPLHSEPAVEGKDLKITIDPELQKQTYDMLRLYFRGDQTGSAVASDPSTGAVLCMVNYPSVDPNNFVGGISEANWKLIADDERAPMLNRATSGRYSPGSIFKPVVGAWAIKDGVITWDSVFPYTIVKDKWTPERGDWVYPPITRVENKGGTCDLYNSIVWSDNIFFAWTAMNMGKDSFIEHCRQLGFGEEIPFDVPVSKVQLMNEGTDFHIKFLADSGYGQGEILMSPLFANLLFCGFSNFGDIMQPYLVDSMWQTQGQEYENTFQHETTVWKEGVYDSYTARQLEPMMSDVMTKGTGRSTNAPYATAGKTGTAEKSNTRDINWICVYKTEGLRNFCATVTIDSLAGEGSIKYEIANTMLVYDHNKES